jgi:hypothetical protein
MATSRKVTPLGLVTALARLRKSELPAVLRAVGTSVLINVTREGAQNIYGRVLAKTGPNAGLARYYTAAMRANVDYRERKIRAGLPESDLNARILAHRETGGVIRMRDKMLRIPLGPALTAARADHNWGRDLKTAGGKGHDGKGFFVLRAKTGNVFLARSEPRGRGKSKQSQIELWYLLRREVRNRPFPWFKRAVDATRARVPEYLLTHLRKLEDGRLTK